MSLKAVTAINQTLLVSCGCGARSAGRSAALAWPCLAFPAGEEGRQRNRENRGSLRRRRRRLPSRLFFSPEESQPKPHIVMSFLVAVSWVFFTSIQTDGIHAI